MQALHLLNSYMKQFYCPFQGIILHRLLTWNPKTYLHSRNSQVHEVCKSCKPRGTRERGRWMVQ